jgi:hypothetical protein
MYLFTVDHRLSAPSSASFPVGTALLLTGQSDPVQNGVWRIGPDDAPVRDESVLRFAPPLGKIRVTVLDDDTRWELTFEPGSDLSSIPQYWVQNFDPDPGAHREFLERLEQLDKESIRALRAVASGDGTQADVDRLAALERQAAQIRHDVWPLLPPDERSPARPPAPAPEPVQ